MAKLESFVARLALVFGSTLLPLHGVTHAEVKPSGGTARDMRVLLSDGHVISLDSAGHRVAGIPRRLDLGSAYGIFDVQVDVANDILYVTPDQVAPLQTRVFQLSSLRLLGLLPGVARVQIPIQADAPYFGALRYNNDLSSQLTTMLEFRENPGTVTTQVRSRKHPEQVVAQSEKYQASGADFSCYVAASDSFRFTRADKRITKDLIVEALAGQEEHANGVFTFGGCWPDGTVWLYSIRNEADQAAFNNVRVVGRDGADVVNFTVPQGYIVGPTQVFPLGRSAGALAMFRATGTGEKNTSVGSIQGVRRDAIRALDVSQPEAPLDGGSQFFAAGEGRDGECVYLVPAVLDERGTQWDRSDRVFNLCADEAAPFVELSLPDELIRINAVNRIRYDDALDDEQRNVALAKLEPIPDELARISEVSVMFVLPK